MGKQIKVFTSRDEITLEQKTNKFIDELPKGYTTDIQFKYAETDDYCYLAVMITFQEGK